MKTKSRRLSPSMIVACLALLVSLTGTSIAASHYIITSTKQIKPSVRKQLKGARGPRGLQGLQGVQGSLGNQGPPGTGNTCNAGLVSSNPDASATLGKYPTFSDVASCSITLSASHKVLIVGQFTAQSDTANAGDAFAEVLVDGALVDGMYWTNVSAATPGAGSGRATLPMSRIVTLASGTHTVTIQGSYYDAGNTITVTARASGISAVDLG